jgi:hypothetical protein
MGSVRFSSILALTVAWTVALTVAWTVALTVALTVASNKHPMRTDTTSIAISTATTLDGKSSASVTAKIPPVRPSPASSIGMAAQRRTT